MKVTAVVPIKLNNERLPGKNIRELSDGKPLISYILNTLTQIEQIDERYVYCSSEDIIPFLNAETTFLKRSSSLDSDSTNFTQIFQSFTDEVSSDIYVYTHATAPFLSRETIKTCIDKVLHEGYDSAFTATEIKDFVWINETPNYDLTNIPRTQDIPSIYVETSGVYVFTKEVFCNMHSRIGRKPYIYPVCRKEAIDINNYDDFKLAQVWDSME